MRTNGNAFLIVGGDSLIGGGVMQAMALRGHKAYATTRRKETLDAARVFLDFQSDDRFVAPGDAGYAFVIAAATHYDRCETDPMARVINAELIPKAIANLLEQGLFVTFISTNSVFGGERPWPGEDDPHEPRIAYASQKSEGEAAARAHAERLGASDRLNIVRLTKVMDANVSPLPTWFDAWRRGDAVTPFADLIFAPISVRFVGEALVRLGEQCVPGNLHLSGAENVDYFDFARALALRIGVAEGRIAPTTAVEKGVHIAFKPTYSGLGMERTTRLSGVKPQPLDELISDIVADLRERQNA